MGQAAPARIAVIYYSSTGNIHRLAQAFADGAAEASAEVRLRRVAELAPDAAIDANHGLAGASGRHRAHTNS